ncbi:MAG: redoxin domain-containing protein [Gemmatimonadetes bacterium]|nr:redoxin domain-containing protein [Gemmatimonadota bacterium]
MIPPVGSPAPDFSLTWKVGQPPVDRTLHADGGPLVVLFFPLAFSPVCTDEMCAVAGLRDRWTSLGARVVGISVDSPWVNVRFAEDNAIPFPLLSDFNKDVARAYGVLNEDYFGMRGVSDRAAFVIDGEGRIAYAWHTEDDSILPDFDAIAEVVRELRG